MWLDVRTANARRALLLAGALAAATGFTFWLGLRATREWERSTVQAAETRANEVVTLLAVAIERDMKGAQTSVLVPFNEAGIQSAPYDLADRFARGFARFPYVESFFVWTETGGADGSTYVFNRADRIPHWDTSIAAEDPFPVVFRRNPPAVRHIVNALRSQSATASRFAISQVSVGGVAYQALAHLMYEGPGATPRLSAAVGFMVDVNWVKAHYFSDVIRQIQRIIGDPTLSIEILDGDGQRVAAVGPPASGEPKHVRSFPLVFADAALLADVPSSRSLPLSTALWTARVGVANEASLAAAGRGTARTLTLLGLGTVAALIALGFTLRAARAAAALATVQSEFVSAVSHEMKTPLSLIRLASDTLANGRYATPAAVGDYGRLIGIESAHLTRLIDNVLCYARINDTTSGYDFESLDIAEVVQETVDRFRPQLSALGFEVQLQLPADPLLVDADHLMMGHLLGNLIDNAIKHAGGGRWLGITVRPEGARVHVEVADRGEGIPAGELSRIFDKFYRRKGTRHRGAGLGLAIVRRIADDHRGLVDVTSTIGQGTSFDVILPSVAS
jgi:signal transduction histidine kinase